MWTRANKSVAGFAFAHFCMLATALEGADPAVRYDDGARYAFIADLHSSNIAVIDTFDRRLLENIALEQTPADMVVNDVVDLLVYIDGKHPRLYTYDLIDRSRNSVALSFTPSALVFHPDGSEIAIAGDGVLSVINPMTGKILFLKDGLTGPVSINYTSDGYSMFITENETGQVFQRKSFSSALTPFATGDAQTTSDLTLSPDSRIALVSTKSSKRMWVRDIYTKRIVAEVLLEGAPLRPYVSSSSKHIVVATAGRQTLVVDAWTNHILNTIEVGDETSMVRTGWLETKGIVSSQGKLHLFDLVGDKKERSFPVEGQVGGMIVVSDSKTLFATQSDSDELLVLDIRREEVLASVPTGLISPSQIAMGITNTLCH